MRNGFVCALVLACVPACGGGDAVGPPKATRYSLESIDGAVPPVVQTKLVSLSANGGPTITCDNDIAGETIEFYVPGGYKTTVDHVIICDDGRANVTSQGFEYGSYVTKGDSVTLTADPTPAGSHTSYAQITGDTLRIGKQVSSGGLGTTYNGQLLIFRARP